MNQRRRRPPFEKVDCQSLIALGVNFFGWLRSRNIMNKWSKKFAVLYKGHVYIFKNENSTNHFKETSFSLYGYKSVQLPILEENEVLWVFKLVHSDAAKSKCFATSSEIELQEWTDRLQEGINFANDMLRQSYANWPDRTTSQLDIYDGVRRSQEGGRYMYEGLSVHNGQSITPSYSQMNIDSNNVGSDVYEEVNRQSTAPIERPPMLPPRPKKENRTPNNYIELENQPIESESCSDFEDDDDDSSEGYCIYENTNDVHYYNVSADTSDVCKGGSSEDEEPVTKRNVRRKTQRRTLAKIEMSEESRYSVISIKSYKAKTSDELDFPKEVKFDVIGQETKRWLIGEIGRRKGFFPAEYVKRIQLPDNETVTQNLTFSVIALRSYKGQSYDEISFRKEDKFNVVGQESERWLVGEVNGNKGLFPAEFVKKCQIVSSKTLSKTKRRESKDSTRQSKYCVIATKSYKAKNFSQISFQKEDKFIVVGEKSSGWLIGEINGEKGLFPSEYVKAVKHLGVHTSV
ncbi:SH3 domain-containing protein 19-like isoform X2 [Mytilus californianus]|uniref:SH3 domain-containing protein 19-like isoform X2 n=1 Tax=Mytilus californianus TaxID=6549 RepID=UPI0022477371|nr:SH3 domain-containing protein 19-like isoform X2 [Mytilus californianus]